MFELHPQLAADTHPVGDLALCRVLLMDDAGWPWLILVPRRPGVREVHELDPDDQARLIGESSLAARAMATLFAADKMNLAALGNVVPQLHVHVIARHHGDPAWPRPVWGARPRQPYDGPAARATAARVAAALGLPAPG